MHRWVSQYLCFGNLEESPLWSLRTYNGYAIYNSDSSQNQKLFFLLKGIISLMLIVGNLFSFVESTFMIHFFMDIS